MRNVLVTGSRGFIGKHLVRELQKRNYNVTMEVDFSFYDDCFQDINEITIGDLLRNRIDTVFHLAAHTDINQSIDNPLIYHENNVTKSLEFMKICADYRGIKKFVFASSAAVYGDNSYSKEPFKETDNCRLQNPYAADKLAVEHYLQAYAFSYGLPYAALRYFNVYGDDGNTKGFIYKLKEAIKENKPVPIANNGLAVRDYIHVSDVVDISIKAALSCWSNFILNVGTGTGHSVLDVVRMASKILNKNLEIENYSVDNEVKYSVADTEIMHRILDTKIDFKTLESQLK